ncbi:hypothetical protein HDU99_004647 [Rhizoclosmatium hyalinum]|nr:hypothetical protein HDU99_004647 [Rhizoclosmatium hyalinum]
MIVEHYRLRRETLEEFESPSELPNHILEGNEATVALPQANMQMPATVPMPPFATMLQNLETLKDKSQAQLLKNLLVQELWNRKGNK